MPATHLTQKNPTSVEALVNLGRFVEAERQVRGLLAESPDDSDLHQLLSRTFIGQKKYCDAESALLQALSHEPDDPFSFYLLSLVYHWLKSFDKELEMAKHAALLMPEEADYLKRLAESYLQSGKVKQAKDVATQIIAIAPDHEETHQLLGDIHLELEDFDRAETYYRSALSFEPENVGLLNDLGRALMGQRKGKRQAIDIFFNALQIEPANTVVRENLFNCTKFWLDDQQLIANKQLAFESLPKTIQLFYNDYRKRNSIFDTGSRFFWGSIWLALLGGFFGLFTFLV